MPSISELVWLYVKRRPFLREILRERVVNYSALARKISKEAFGTAKQEDAVKMALVRLSTKMAEVDDSLESRILSILHDTSISIKNKVSVVISSRPIPDIKPLSYAESKGVLTYILEEAEIKLRPLTKSERNHILHTKPNLNLIVLHSPPSLEEVPGVISHILNALSSEGINVVEFVSCYTDTLLVVQQAETLRAYEILNELTK